MSTQSVRKEQTLSDFESEFDRMFGDQAKFAPTPVPASLSTSMAAAMPAVAPTPVAATTVVLPTRPVTAPAEAPVAAPAAAAPPAKTVFNDPLLAELARIVGNAPPPRPAPAPVAAAPAPQAARHADPLAAFEEELRRFDELHRSNLAAARPQAVEPAPDLKPVEMPLAPTELDLRGAAPDPASLAPVTQFVPDHGQPTAQEMAYQEPVIDDPVTAEPRLSTERPRARRVVALLGSAAAIAVVGLVGAVAMKGKGPSLSGEPPVIAAKTQPLKEKPTDPGGVEIPGQDRQVLAKGATDPKGQATVLNKEEQPVDLNQTPKRDVARVVLPAPGSSVPAGGTAPIIMPPPGTGSVAPAADASAPPAQPQAATPAASAGGFEAKRVRSVKVGPEGETLKVAPPVAAPAPTPSPSATIAAAPPPTSTAPSVPATTAAPKVPTTTGTTPTAQPKSEARPAAAVRAQAPQTPARVATRTTPEAAEEPANGATPLSIRPPSGASPTRPVPRTTAAAPEAGGQKGTFAVQLAASPSEADARSTAARLKQNAALSGYNPTWKTSEVNGRTVYRVRVSNLSRESANELCGKIKAGGGSCFVAGN